eukprot:PITA_23608
MAPRMKDAAWAYVEMIDNQMHSPTKQIEDIRKELLEKFEKFEEEKARQKEIEVEIGRKRSIKHIVPANPNLDYDGSSSIPSTYASNPFRYVPPSLESIREKGKGKIEKKGDIKGYFTITPSSPFDSAHGPQANRGQMQPTLDDHWKKELREIACDYIARWWYDADIPFNTSCSPHYEPMFDAIFAVGKGFTVPTMHDLWGSLLQKEVMSIDGYLKDFKSSWVKTGCTIMSDGWIDQRNRTIIIFLSFSHREPCF